MLAGNVAAGVASSGWFGDYTAAGQPLHASAPSITASDTSTASGTQAGNTVSGQLDWIVQFNAAATSGIASAAGTARLLPQSGADFHILEGLGAVGEVLVRSSSLTAAQATAALQGDSPIAWFEADSLKQIDAAVPNDPQFPQQWDLDNTGQSGGTAGCDIDATQAWNITTGSKGVVVAEIDSGVDYTDPDLAANIWTNPHAGQDGFSGDVHGYNFVDNTGDPMDDDGHGTFVAGEIGAVGNNGTGVTGVNWNVTIMPLKFLDANGDGYTSDAIRAINYSVMERTEYGVNVRVINASWCSSLSDPGLNAAIQAAGNAGILFVAAAGNSASNNDLTPQYPASSGLANVVSVAASDSNDRLAPFSDYGANSVNLAAPGVNIYGTLPGGKYGYLSGTSMATPLVAGVAALAWAADPNATVAEVRSALLQGVDKIPALAGKVSSGGVLNAYNTLKLLSAPSSVPTPAPSPAPTPPPAPAPVPTIVAPGTNPTTAIAVAIGSGAQGDIANSADTSYFKVQVVAGQCYTFETVLGTLYDSVLTLLGTNGQTVIAQNDDMAPGNRSSRITWQATQSGTYYLAVSTYPGSPAGSFTLVTSGPSASTLASAPSPTPSPAPIPAPAPTAPSLLPIGNQTLVAGGSVTLSLSGSSPSGSAVSYSARPVSGNGVSVAVSGNQLTIRAAANCTGNTQIAVLASSGVMSAVQSFNVTVTQPSGSLQGCSVAIPSATLQSAAAAVVLSSNVSGTATSSVASSSRGLDPAALDTLFYALGR